MLYYGLDVHKEFIQVCEINASQTYKKEYQIAGSRESIETFARGLQEGDQVVLEATFNSWSVYSILIESSAQVKVANPRDVKAIAHARVKTDKIDAHILAQLLRMDFIPEVKMPSDSAWQIRQLGSHRRLLVKHRTAVKNAIRSLLNQKLIASPYPTAFTQKWLKWLKGLKLAEHEAMMRDHLIEQLLTLQNQIDRVDAEFRVRARHTENVKLLVSIPGVGYTVATGLVAAIDDVNRFKTPDQLASYFGLVPRISQSASRSYFGSITKEGTAYGRWLAIEAAQSLALSNAPLAGSYHRIKSKKGHNVAVTALARKLIVLVWHLLTNRQPYRYADPVRTRAKLREMYPEKPPMEEWAAKYKTVDQIYQEFQMPLPSSSTSAERRAAASNRRQITRSKRKPIHPEGCSEKQNNFTLVESACKNS